MGVYRVPQRTVATPEQAFASFRRAAPELPPAGLLVLLSQWALESGGGAKMKNWNGGGIKATPGGAHDWSFFTTQEDFGSGKKTHPAPPPERQPFVGLDGKPVSVDERITCFRAYASLDASTKHQVSFLQTPGYVDAWPHVVDGDAYAFGLALADQVGARYYTASALAYAAALVTWFSRFGREMPGWSADA